MSIAAPGPLLDRVEQYVRETFHRDVLVPVEGTGTYLTLVAEMATIAAEEGGADLAVLVDAASVSDVNAIANLCRESGQVYVFGEPPDCLHGVDGIVYCDFGATAKAGDRFFLAIASTLSYVALGHDSGSEEERGPRPIQGRWSGLRALVRSLADLLLEPCGRSLHADISILPDREMTQSCNLRLMSVLSRHYSTERRNAVMAKSDLSSVLDILKAVSARRRTHDILYIFVEKIASAVGIDRCSIVRVWGDESEGHVLASHEDASLRDVLIDLSKYPEIMHSMESRSKVVINNVANNPLTSPFSDELDAAGITAILVIPIVLFDENVGSLFLRAVQRGGIFYRRDVNFCEIAAESAANALERAHLFESIQSANQRLEHLAVTDGLTGLFNHRYFRDRLREEYDRSIRYRIPLACMLIDVDDFKKINDQYGHLQGDSILRELAARAQKVVRKNDIIARYGGEEIVAIMPQTDLLGAEKQAERLLDMVTAEPYEGMPGGVTVSIGVAVLDHDNMGSPDALVRAADEALYRAKSLGKRRVEVYNPGQP